MKKSTFKEIIAIFLVLLFVYTASSKLLGHERFVFQMKLSQLWIMVKLAPVLGWVIPIIELGIAILLTAGIFNVIFLNPGLWSSLILIAIFEIYITALFLTAKTLPCACGGIISLMSWKGHLLFNAFVFILIALVLVDFKQFKLIITNQNIYARNNR